MTPEDETYLLTLAGLLRGGICADPVPAYSEADEARYEAGLDWLIRRTAVRLTWRSYARAA